MHTTIVDYRISKEEYNTLKSLNYNILLCPPHKRLYNAICGHPDIQIALIDFNNVIVHKDMEDSFVEHLLKLNLKVHKSLYSLEETYPQDIILNSLILGDIFIHKLNSTDPKLLELIKDKTLMNVKQGYTKCSTAIVSDKAIITSDQSIIRTLHDTEIDILYVPPGDIELPGITHGFIGGTCGLLDNEHIGFFGDLNYYKYGNEIKDFLRKHRVTPIYLRKGNLIDRGSLFVV
jgi:hypothetical protein